MFDIIENNPYRILGSYSDSSLRDILANAGKIKAFAKIGRSTTFDTDSLCPSPIIRTEESVDAALALVQSDAERFLYSIFWYNQAGIDFGTSSLISGDVKGGAAKFITAIESTPIAILQNVVGDRTDSISALDLLYAYIEKLKDENCADEAIAGCISASQVDTHISKLSSLQKGNISDVLKSIADSVSEIPVENTKEALDKLKELIEESDKILNENNVVNDITLSGPYDQICKNVRSKVVSITNDVYDKIGKIEKKEFVSILESCLSILKSVDTSAASAGTTTKYHEDINTLSKDVKDADNAYLLAIASNENICWHCGNKATTTKTKKYEKKEEERIGFNTKRVTTYTKSVTFHICDECKEEDSRAENWMFLGVAIVLCIEIALAIYFTGLSDYYDWQYDWSWIWFIIIGNLVGGCFITYGIGFGLGWVARRIFASKKIRKFIRTESDHPLVKRVKSEGFS